MITDANESLPTQAETSCNFNSDIGKALCAVNPHKGNKSEMDSESARKTLELAWNVVL